MNQRTVPLNNVFPKPAEPSDSFIDLDRLAAILSRRIKGILACMVVAIALAAVYLLLATPVYTSMTQILLDDSLAKYAEETTSERSTQQVDMQISSAVEILKSNELAQRVVDSIHLDENEIILNPPRSVMTLVKDSIRSTLSLVMPGSEPVSEKAARQGRKAKAAALLQQSLTAERVARSSVVALSYKSTDPQLAAQVTRAYAAAYLTDQLNANFDATEQASVWLQERLADLQQRSQTAALEVESFKAENGLTSARGELMSEQQLADLNSQLIIAQADAASASARYEQFKSIVDQGPENAVNNATISSKETDNSAIQGMKGRYQAIAKREREVTETFGADHQQAVALRAEKADLTQQIYLELKQLTASYSNEFAVAQSRVASLRENIGGVVGKNSESNKSLVVLRGLEQKATALKTLYESYLGRFEAASQQGSFPVAKARVISEAGVASAPSSPRKTMVLALASVLGLMVGAGLAGFAEFRERFFRIGEDVSSHLGLKFLGYVPDLGTPKTKPKVWSKSGFGAPEAGSPKAAAPELGFEQISRMAVDRPRSTFAETLRNTKLASDILLLNKPKRVIGIVSALPGEGKSTVAANLAGLLAMGGKRTLLIDADLRNPGLTRAMTQAPVNGLIEVVLGEVPWTSAVKIDSRTKLAILPIVMRDHLLHTSELLSSQGMIDLIANARNVFDYVIVDLAPIVPVVDAKAFCPQVDGLIFVAEWGVTPIKVVKDALKTEPELNAKIIGVILNKTNMKDLAKYSDFGGAERYRQKYLSYYVDDNAA